MLERPRGQGNARVWCALVKKAEFKKRKRHRAAPAATRRCRCQQRRFPPPWWLALARWMRNYRGGRPARVPWERRQRREWGRPQRVFDPARRKWIRPSSPVEWLPPPRTDRYPCRERWPCLEIPWLRASARSRRSSATTTSSPTRTSGCAGAATQRPHAHSPGTGTRHRAGPRPGVPCLRPGPESRQGGVHGGTALGARLAQQARHLAGDLAGEKPDWADRGCQALSGLPVQEHAP